MKLVLQVAIGILLATIVVGVFNIMVDRYQFERRCLLIEGYIADQTCTEKAWFSNN